MTGTQDPSTRSVLRHLVDLADGVLRRVEARAASGSPTSDCLRIGEVCRIDGAHALGRVARLPRLRERREQQALHRAIDDAELLVKH